MGETIPVKLSLVVQSRRASSSLSAAGTLRAVIPKVEAAAHGRQVLDALATI